MGLADFAKQKLNETLDKKMQIEEDAAKFYSYVSQHEDEIVADVNKYHMKMVNCDEVGIQSLARDVVRKLKHDENGAYVDAVQYRIYVQYNGNGDFSRLFIIRGYTGGNGNSIDTSTSASISTSAGEYDDEDDDDIDEIVSQVSESGSQRVKPQREESEEERREKEERRKKRREKEEKRKEEARKEKQELKKRVDEINNAPMPEAKDIIMEIKTCEQKSSNDSLSYKEQQAYESRAKLLTEYAKQKCANNPEVKAYLRKKSLHDKRFLIMWCVFLVAAVVVFIVCEEWWHYVLAVLGTIVVAVVLGVIHMAKS